jgi:hypothetical protein
MEYHLDICTREEPGLLPMRAGHDVRCWLYEDGEGHRAPRKQG